MENRKTESFKPLTISVEKLPASMAQQAKISEYATDRARLLLGCYRTGDANDPDTYVAAIAATLARYPEQVITEVTHPVTGLPKQKSWLPTVKEVFDACEEAVEFTKQHEARLKRIKEQFEMREREARGERPTMEQLKEKYGECWGLDTKESAKIGAFNLPTPTWDEIVKSYSADPSRIAALAKSDNDTAQ